MDAEATDERVDDLRDCHHAVHDVLKRLHRRLRVRSRAELIHALASRR